jgi:hypothetical protein
MYISKEKRGVLFFSFAYFDFISENEEPIIFNCFKTVLSILKHALFVNSQNGGFILIF